MFSTFFKFELKAWLRSPMPWIFLFVFGLLCFGATISDDISIGGSFGSVKKNAPFVMQSWYSVFSILGLLLATAFMNSAALRDFDRNTSQIVFSKPVSKSGYYFGHFFGGLIASMIPMLGISLGVFVGGALNSVFNWIDVGRFGASGLTGHIEGFLTFVVPNAIFIGGIVYAVAINTRSTMYSFITTVAIMVGYIMAGTLMKNLDNETLAAMTDPFGLRAFGIATKYWTVDQKNTSAMGLTGLMLWNRLIWMAVGLFVLFIGYLKFNFSEKGAGKPLFGGFFKKKQSVLAQNTEGGKLALRFSGDIPHVQPESNWGMTWTQLVSQIKTEWKFVVRSTPFILLSLIGLLNAWGSFANADNGYNTHELPVTYSMINIVRGSFYLFTMIVMVYFSGTVVWKERNARMSEIIDALPAKNWTAFLGKYIAILGSMMLLQLIVIAVAIATQAYKGFFDFKIWLYVRELLLMDMLGFAFILALAFLIQALSPNMYLGFFIVVIFLALSNFGLQALDWVSNMVDFGGLPNYTLSDFYGYAPFKSTLSWFSGYWVLFCSLLGLAAILFWARGRETGVRGRFRMAALEWKNYKGAAYFASFAWAVVASWVFYNTKMENKIVSPKEFQKLQVRYENEYKRFENKAQPRVYDVKFDITLNPEKRSLLANGAYKVRNNGPLPIGSGSAISIDTVFMNIPRDIDFELKANPRLKLVKDDKELKCQIYKIEPALAVNDSLLLNFTAHFEPKGFQNELKFSRLVQNGTFFDNSEIAPVFGYSDSYELTDKNDRKKYGLAEKSRLPALNRFDTLHRKESYIGMSGDFVDVETIFRTSPDQIVIAPGSLQREWTENGMRCFHYKLDHKSFNFYSFLSAQYEVSRKKWNGVDLEVYYHKGHEFNVPRMMDAMQKALEYYTKNFGPYYHKQCRVIEFPRFSSFAQAFPGSMPYSEGIGFIQDFKENQDDIDMVTYVAAHEIGHQWWGHQECGSRMQGGEMLVETFAQYSALMVMEHTYGRDKMGKFLKYEMDRYLRGRSVERLNELPLAKCENQQYIHYNKGSIAMYALKETIGEDKLNTAMRNFLGKFRYSDKLYPVSLDAIDEFYAQTPDSLKYIVKDWFEDITIFENECQKTTMKELPNGKFEVTIDITSKKLKADENGKNTEVPLNDYIEIGAYAKPAEKKKYGKLLARQRVKITKANNTFTFVVDEKPFKAGVDPFSLLVDLSPENNMKEFK
jgi:ABC-2 type transport system permease protein